MPNGSSNCSVGTGLPPPKAETARFTYLPKKLKYFRKKREPKPANDVIYRDIEEQMKRVLGTKVSIRRKNKNAGKIEIDYYSADELERILDMIRSINT